MTITVLTGTADSSSPFAPTPHASTAVGDLMILGIRGVQSQSSTSASGSVTVPSGWTLVGRSEAPTDSTAGGTPGTAVDTRATAVVYSKVATSGDLGTAVTITLGSRWTTSVTCEVTTYPGAVGFHSTVEQSTRAFGIGTSSWTPTLPTISRDCMGIVHAHSRSSAGSVSSSGWSGNGRLAYVYTSPPLPTLTLTETANLGAAAVAFAITDIPDTVAGGWHLGRQTWGVGSGGWH